jgi:hypothetical protein
VRKKRGERCLTAPAPGTQQLAGQIGEAAIRRLAADASAPFGGCLQATARYREIMNRAALIALLVTLASFLGGFQHGNPYS